MTGKNLSADFSWRIFLEGQAPARPQNFGTAEAAPSNIVAERIRRSKFNRFRNTPEKGSGQKVGDKGSIGTCPNGSYPFERPSPTRGDATNGCPFHLQIDRSLETI